MKFIWKKKNDSILLNAIVELHDSYIKFANGIIIEFGRHGPVTSGDAINFKASYLNGTFPYVIVCRDAVGNYQKDLSLYYHWIDNKQFYIYTTGTTHVDDIYFNYIAIGRWK